MIKLPFFQKPKTNKKWYLGLFLKEYEGMGIAMSWENGQMRIVEKEKFIYSDGWENLTQDIDDLLAKMEQRLGNQFTDTIFFVYSHFIDEKTNDIKKPYLSQIKELVKSLELRALGYIECYEAVVGFLEKREEMPLTAIVAELDKTQISVFVYKGGRIIHKKILERTHNLVDDLLSSFEPLKGNIFLPTRIILYNSKDLDDESTKILTHRWSEDYFVQIPRVEVVKDEEVVTGLMNIFQNQINEREESVATEESVPAPKEVMGFVVGEDVEEKPEKTKKETNIKVNVKDKISQIIPKNINFRLPSFKISGKIPVIIGLVIILSALFADQYFLHKAQVKLLLPFQSINKSLSVDIPVRIATMSADISESVATTGSKEIGDPAHGSVVIRNFSNQLKTFSQGTKISAGGISFTLDSDVKVASASLSPDGSSMLSGAGNAKVTATAIGPEGNLAKDQRFTIDGLPDATYFAVSDSIFSGGSKKEVQTVAEKDIENLKAMALKQAPSPQTGNGLIPSLTKTSLENPIFSKEIGEEATDINLKAKVDSIYYMYDKNELLNKLSALITPEIRRDYSLDKNHIGYHIDNAKISGEIATVKITFDAKAMQNINTNEIINMIKGKSQNSVGTLLKNNYQIHGYELHVKEPLPFLNNYLPFIGKNITVTISSY